MTPVKVIISLQSSTKYYLYSHFMHNHDMLASNSDCKQETLNASQKSSRLLYASARKVLLTYY